MIQSQETCRTALCFYNIRAMGYWQGKQRIASLETKIARRFFYTLLDVWKMSFEHYVYKNQKKLRCGYTTGTCAALAAKGAALLLFGGERAERISIVTPKGISVETKVLDLTQGEDFACCAVCKDSGDDPDVTNGMLVYAHVEKTSGSTIEIDGGAGVGRVTQKGLDQPVGAAAINRIPRQMITKEVAAVCREFSYQEGVKVVISIPGGEEIAGQTFNPRLGIQGGISILGTSGIVEPMSRQAITESTRLELSRLKAGGISHAVITPGNYGEDFLKRQFKKLSPVTIKCSNFIGETLDSAVVMGFERLLFVGHIGKMIKVAGGIMDTHSQVADGRMEIMAAHAALNGADTTAVAKIMDCATTDEGIEILRNQGLLEKTMASLMDKIDFHLKRRAGKGIWIEAMVFSNQYGLLGKTTAADRLIKTLLEDG